MLAGHAFDVNRTIARVGKDVHLVRLSHTQAEDQLASGKLVAVVTVPPDFLVDLRGMLRSGQVDPATNAWRPGASGWAPLSTYSELDAGGTMSPPPPPPVK